MSRKNIIFDNKKINKSNKSNLYKKTKNYLVYMTWRLIKYYFLKKNHLNTFLDIMMIISLDLYV